MVLGEPRLRLLLAFSWLLGLLVVPEGLAVPYAAQLGVGAGAVGVLLSAGPAGVAVGTVLFTRFTPPGRRGWLLGPLSTAAGLPLVVCAVHPGVVVTAVLWAVSGACTAYQVQVVTEFEQLHTARRLRLPKLAMSIRSTTFRTPVVASRSGAVISQISAMRDVLVMQRINL